jgi:hypothetical protein
MLRILKSLLNRKIARNLPPAKVGRTRLAVEGMEERRVMSVNPTVPVANPEVDYFVVAGAPATIQAGTAVNLTITEYAYATGKPVTSGAAPTATLNFDVGGTSAPLQTINLANGTGKVTLTSLTKAESGIVFATYGSTSNLKTYITGNTPTIVVTHAPVSQFLIAAPTTAAFGTKFNVTVTAEDKFGNVDPTYAAVPTFTASDGQTVTVASFSWSSGVGTASLALNVADSLTITASGIISTGVARATTATIVVAVPSTANSALWSGYVASPGVGSVTAAGATWIEPTTTGAGASSIWVGIDGYNGSTVEQIGVATSVVGGVTVYTPWIEFFGDQNAKGATGPDYYQTNLPASYVVHAGDTISASVALVAGTTSEFSFQMKITPKSGAAVENYSSIQTMSYVAPQRSTVEWIAENPNKGVQPLANFGAVTFTAAWATVNGATGGINALKYLVDLNLSSSEGHDSTSNPPTLAQTVGFTEPSNGAGSSSFSVTWTGGANGTTTAGKTSNGASTNAAANNLMSRAQAMDVVFAALGPTKSSFRAGLITELAESNIADMLFAWDAQDEWLGMTM